jgi:hypothetical protein
MNILLKNYPSFFLSELSVFSKLQRAFMHRKEKIKSYLNEFKEILYENFFDDYSLFKLNGGNI